MASETMFESAGRLFFSRERVKSLEKDLNTAGVNMPADSFAGYMSLNVIVVTIILALLVLLYQPTGDLITGLVGQYADVPYPLIALLVLVVSWT